MSAVLNLARRTGLAVAAVGIFNEFFLYDGKYQQIGTRYRINLQSFNVVVEPGTRAVIFDKINGIADESMGEGTHFRVPVIQVSLSFILAL